MIFEILNNPTLLVITGPTAVGKTDYCIQLAKKHNTAIISADSRQFYREMHIGTAKPTVAQLQEVPHYFIGHLSIFDYYSVSRFEEDVLQLLPTLFKKSNLVIMTGGSGLYLDAVCYGMDPLPSPEPSVRKYVTELFEKEGVLSLQKHLQFLDPDYYKIVDIANPKRLMRAIEVCLQTGKPFSSFLAATPQKRDFEIVKYCLMRPRETLFQRINERVDTMLANNLLDEVKSLFPHRALNALNTVGYKELFAYLEGTLSLEKAIENMKVNTRRYAKRQISWFKRDQTYQYLNID